MKLLEIKEDIKTLIMNCKEWDTMDFEKFQAYENIELKIEALEKQLEKERLINNNIRTQLSDMIIRLEAKK